MEERSARAIRCVMIRDWEGAEALLNAGVDPDYAGEGFPILHALCFLADSETVASDRQYALASSFIHDYPTSLRGTDSLGRTPLEVANQFRNFRLVKVIEDAAANPQPGPSP